MDCRDQSAPLHRIPLKFQYIAGHWYLNLTYRSIKHYISLHCVESSLFFFCKTKWGAITSLFVLLQLFFAEILYVQFFWEDFHVNLVSVWELLQWSRDLFCWAFPYVLHPVQNRISYGPICGLANPENFCRKKKKKKTNSQRDAGASIVKKRY